MLLFLFKKIFHPFVYPIIFKNPKKLLEDITDKYNEERETNYFVQEAPLGLTEFEQTLVNGPMKKKGYVLDVGCGTGREAIVLTKLGHKVKAIDISPKMIAIAKEIAKKEGLEIEFEELSVTELQEEDNFDYCLFSSGVYNSIPTRELRVETIRRIMRSLKPLGTLFLSVGIRGKRKFYNRDTFIDAIRSMLKFFLGKGFKTEVGDALISEISPQSTAQTKVFHHFFPSFKEIKDELINSGFRVKMIKKGLWQLTKLIDNEEYLSNTGRNLILIDKTNEILKEFKTQSSDVLVLKGLYFAFNVYPDYGLRPMSDIDFLIKKKDLCRIIKILNTIGYTEVSPKLQKSYGGDITFCNYDKVYVDIHWNLCQYERFKGIINITDDFWQRAVEFDLDGMRAKTLFVEDHIIYIGLHYCLIHLFEDIKGVYDIFYLVRKFNPDWGKIIHNADKYGIKMPLYYSLQKSQEISGLKLPDFVLARLMPHPFKKKIIDYLFGRRKKLIFRILLQALMLDNLWDTLRVLGRALKAIPRSYKRQKAATFKNTAVAIKT